MNTDIPEGLVRSSDVGIRPGATASCSPRVVDVVEGAAATVLVLGGLGAFVLYVRDQATHRRTDPYRDLRRHLSRIILLGLEVLIIADIVRRRSWSTRPSRA